MSAAQPIQDPDKEPPMANTTQKLKLDVLLDRYKLGRADNLAMIQRRSSGSNNLLIIVSGLIVVSITGKFPPAAFVAWVLSLVMSGNVASDAAYFPLSQPYLKDLEAKIDALAGTEGTGFEHIVVASEQFQAYRERIMRYQFLTAFSLQAGAISVFAVYQFKCSPWWVVLVVAVIGSAIGAFCLWRFHSTLSKQILGAKAPRLLVVLKSAGGPE